MNTPFKMKGWSPFTKKTKTKTYSTQADSPDRKQKLSMKIPKSHPVTPSTKEQKKKSKGTVTGSEATETKSPNNPYPYGTKQYYRWEADYAESIKQG